MEEELFDIKSRFGEYPSYKVTKSGKVFSYRQGNILKPLSTVLDSGGYPIVKLYDTFNKIRTIAVHRIIADTFIPNPNSWECINHKDENKQNNSVDNLEWCTKAYNNCYNDKAIKIGLKLRDSNPLKRKVNQLDENGIVINTFSSIREAARTLGNIRKDANIINGIKTHQKRYGYFWEYASV